ncbi:MAG: methyltransferase [Candidatus Thalassarchaeaceae archaeon]
MTGRGPHERLYDSISSFLGENPPSEIPRKWERFSDIAILPSGSFRDEDWGDVVGPDLWKAVAHGLNVERLGVMGEVTGRIRKSGVKMLLGDDDWVVRRENGVDYGYHVTKCMFSAGNVNERRRMGEIVRRGEVIVDLFAGIGYYSLPILVHSEVEHVHCCEWNNDAVESLEWSLERNNVSSLCTVHRGDNRETSKSIGKVADRIIMGLLPTSERSFEAAMGVLSDSGGVIHVHGLAKPNEYSEWAEGVMTEICNYREGSSVRKIAVNRVKSYAPRWDHVVLDLEIN